MICNKCGEKNPDEARFCRSCGANLVPTDIQNDEAKTKNKSKFGFKQILANKKIIIGGASIVFAVVVLIIAISSIGSLTKGELYITTENYISSVYSNDTEKTVIFFNDVPLASTINGRASNVSSSTNGDVAAFISEDDVLYIVEKENIQKIADDIIAAELSYDGNVMAYLNKDNVLYTIQLENRKIEKVADDVVNDGDPYMGNYFDCFKLSPDGNTILYITEDGDESVSYIKIGSTRTKLEKFYGLFTSNDGKVIYGVGYADDMLGTYDLKTGSFIKLSDEADDLIVNVDHDELLFSVNSKYYLSINGGERIKIGNYVYLRPILPDHVAIMKSNISDRETYYSAVKSFIGVLMVYYEDDGTYGIGYIDENYEMQKVIKNVDPYYDVYLTDDYDTVYYIRNKSLYRATKELNFESEKLISDVERFKVSSDGQKIYYTNSDDELLCHYKDEDNMIADNVCKTYLSITDTDIAYFMTDYSDYSGTLYSCSDGKNKVRIADDVTYVFVYPEFVKYFKKIDSKDGYQLDVYISTNKKDFKKVVSYGDGIDDHYILGR